MSATPSIHRQGREPLSFAYWTPAFSSTFIASKIEQQHGWDLDFNIRLARAAEQAGVDYALTATRFASSHGADGQHEALALSAFILANTQKLNVISAVLSGLWHPGTIAKQGSTLNVLSNGRWHINVVSGWFRGEYTAFGQPWLEHDERYRRSEEFIQVLKGIWTQKHFDFKGDFYSINDYTLGPPTVSKPHPLIFQGGSSTAARQMAGRYSDWYFTNGGSLEEIEKQVKQVTGYAAEHGRRVKIAVNGFVIARETEQEARDVYKEIVRLADWDAVKGFGEQVKEAGSSTKDGIGNWAKSSPEDLLQWNDGFKTGLIGTPEQIAERIVAYKKIGVDLLLVAFVNYIDEMEYFGKRVVPLIRELEANDEQLRLSA